MRKAIMKLSGPEEIEITLTITLPVHGWRLVYERENYNPFRDAVWAALKKVDGLGTETEFTY